MKSLVPINGSALPQRLQGRKQSGMLANAKSGIQASFAVVGYEGRNWFLKWQGEKILLRNPQTNQPDQTLEVVIVGISDAVSKIYYAKQYVQGDDARPDCASTRGIAPDAGVPHPQSKLCETCKLGAWGSRITEAGKRAKACRDSRRIAVVPLVDIGNESFGGPMLLRVPPTSLQALSKYAEFLSIKGLDMPWVATRISFDFDVTYPKLVFEAMGVLDDSELDLAEAASQHPLIDDLFNNVRQDDAIAGSTAASDEPSAPAQPEEDEEDDEEEQAPPPPAPAPPAPEPAAQAAPASAPGARKAGNPFQAAAAANKSQPQPAPAPAAAKRPRLAAPEQAPSDLNAAINDLLSS